MAKPSFLHTLQQDLQQRQDQGSLRILRLPVPGQVDFSSNDYLGLAHDPAIESAAQDWLRQFAPANGSGGSRLLNGHSLAAAQLELELARFFDAEAALFFPTGYMANLAVLSALPQRHDAVFYDQLSHASLKDGLRLGLAPRYSFRHNDLDHLRQLLETTRYRHAYIVTESIFSMDGDQAPVPEMAMLAQRFDAALIIDEAHSTGLYGPEGQGLCYASAVHQQVPVRIMTFGKAPGVHGAAVLGPQPVIDFLINNARPFIYSTAPGHHQLAQVAGSMQVLACAQPLRQALFQNIGQFRQLAHQAGIEKYLLPSPSAIQLVTTGQGAVATRKLAQLVQQAGYDVRPILSPTVPTGQERLRICLHANHTHAQLQGLISALAAGIKQLADPAVAAV